MLREEPRFGQTLTIFGGAHLNKNGDATKMEGATMKIEGAKV